MALLDVTSILTDPDFASVFSVVRRTEIVSVDTGLSEISEMLVPDLVGVITPGDAMSLVRDDVGQVTGRSISVVTKYPLRMSSEGVQPDIVRWNSVDYTVITESPYLNFGAGFVQATAMSMSTSTPLN